MSAVNANSTVRRIELDRDRKMITVRVYTEKAPDEKTGQLNVNPQIQADWEKYFGQSGTFRYSFAEAMRVVREYNQELPDAPVKRYVTDGALISGRPEGLETYGFQIKREKSAQLPAMVLTYYFTTQDDHHCDSVSIRFMDGAGQTLGFQVVALDGIDAFTQNIGQYLDGTEVTPTTVASARQ